jgi:hypothetical protein
MLHKDVWINVPAKATDDYVTQLASFLKNNLDADRVVYVEYSNEVWNGIFSQFADNQNAAIAEVNAGNSPLNADGETNPVYWGWRRVAKRLKEISDIFANVWGQSAINARVRPVLSGQHANPLVLRKAWSSSSGRTAAPASSSTASPTRRTSAPRASTPIPTRRSTSTSTAGAARSPTRSTSTAPPSPTLRPGEHELRGRARHLRPNNITTKRNASLDPRMRTLVNNYLNGWYNQGGGLFMWFVTGPTNWNTQNGTWGLTDSIENFNSPKLLGTVGRRRARAAGADLRQRRPRNLRRPRHRRRDLPLRHDLPRQPDQGGTASTTSCASRRPAGIRSSQGLQRQGRTSRSASP